MGKGIAGFSMSLDGFIAAPDDSVPHIFDWYDSGNVRFDWPGNDMKSDVTPASAAYLRGMVEQTGALVVGRRVFDITDGVASAVELAQAEAGDKWIGVAGPNIAQQCLDLGLLDEISIELAPVILGAGV